ncbi:glycoside hydrolase family 18 protein [Bipolaris maydis C5]|uniref:chitinase n=1 Tax=Cochliobolus heterostrophus (strain C5 / ATCC 48332 / race O) TaxID=701091 RepID=M2TAW4_COCH5|nr:glycoside hydrolase family 18 protein [Bipolaris maydis C5]KAJ6215114.1 glycoside hydrolase family 18 protein [Bipolaris maydis]
MRLFIIALFALLVTCLAGSTHSIGDVLPAIEITEGYFQGHSIIGRDAPKCSASKPCIDGVCCNSDGYCDPHTAKRRIAYYATSNIRRRSCEQIWPVRLNTTGFTHIVLGFAVFDPKNFTVGMQHPDDGEVYKQFLRLPDNVRKGLAIGGWEMSNEGPTRTAWSDMSSTKSNRKAFIDSLKQFLNTWKFTGIEIHWEWPGASNRGGKPADAQNQVDLIHELREYLGKDFIISVVLPAQSVYLENMAPLKMQSVVDWFTVLTYDLHGSWDAFINGLGPKIKPHTDLAEIDSALNLLSSASLDPAKINMGLANYGRGFTVANQTCKYYGCEFTGPSKAGSCTREDGLLSACEISRIIREKNLTPQVIYGGAGVKEISWDDQWIGYDDHDTLAMKLTLANKRCLGGTSLWAIEHDYCDGGGVGGPQAPQSSVQPDGPPFLCFAWLPIFCPTRFIIFCFVWYSVSRSAWHPVFRSTWFISFTWPSVVCSNSICKSCPVFNTIIECLHPGADTSANISVAIAIASSSSIFSSSPITVAITISIGIPIAIPGSASVPAWITLNYIDGISNYHTGKLHIFCVGWVFPRPIDVQPPHECLLPANINWCRAWWWGFPGNIEHHDGDPDSHSDSDPDCKPNNCVAECAVWRTVTFFMFKRPVCPCVPKKCDKDGESDSPSDSDRDDPKVKPKPTSRPKEKNPRCKLFGCGCGWMGLSFGPGCPGLEIEITSPCGLFGCNPCVFFGCPGTQPSGIIGYDGYCPGGGCEPCPPEICSRPGCTISGGCGPKPGPAPTKPPNRPDPDDCDDSKRTVITERFVWCTEGFNVSALPSSLRGTSSTMVSSLCLPMIDATVTMCGGAMPGFDTTTTQTGTKTVSSNGPACIRAPLSLDDDEGDNSPNDPFHTSKTFASNTTSMIPSKTSFTPPKATKISLAPPSPSHGPMDKFGHWKVKINQYMFNDYSEVNWKLYDPNGNHAGEHNVHGKGMKEMKDYIQSVNRPFEHMMPFGVDMTVSNPHDVNKCVVNLSIKKEMPGCKSLRGEACRPYMTTETFTEDQFFMVSVCDFECGWLNLKSLLEPSDLWCQDLNDADWEPMANGWKRVFECGWKGF